MAKADLTQRDMMIALHTEILGINGRGGMRQDIADLKEAGQNGRKKLHDKIEEVESHVDGLKEEMVTKNGCAVNRKEIIDNQINPPEQRRRAEVLKVRVFELSALGAVIGAVYGLVELIKLLVKLGG